MKDVQYNLNEQLLTQDFISENEAEKIQLAKCKSKAAKPWGFALLDPDVETPVQQL